MGSASRVWLSAHICISGLAFCTHLCKTAGQHVDKLGSASRVAISVHSRAWLSVNSRVGLSAHMQARQPASQPRGGGGIQAALHACPPSTPHGPMDGMGWPAPTWGLWRLPCQILVECPTCALQQLTVYYIMAHVLHHGIHTMLYSTMCTVS